MQNTTQRSEQLFVNILGNSRLYYIESTVEHLYFVSFYYLSVFKACVSFREVLQGLVPGMAHISIWCIQLFALLT